MTGKIIKWILEDDDFAPVDTISLVDSPAIEVDWMAFNASKGSVKTDNVNMEEFAIQAMFADEQKKSYRFEVPQERFQELEGQNMVVAPAMIADKLILRIDENGDPYYGFFDSSAIKTAAYAFQKFKLIDKFNINHDDNQVAEGVYLAETWLVQDTELDKSQYFGYRLPKGSWMTVLRIEDQDLYDNYIATGELKGLSVEAFLLEKVILNKVKL